MIKFVKITYVNDEIVNIILLDENNNDINKLKSMNKYIKCINIFDKFNKYLNFNTELLFNINSQYDDCQVITTKYDQINVPSIKIDDKIIVEDKYNEDDICAFIGHEFGHLYYRKHENLPSIWRGNKRWDDEFYADRYCQEFLSALGMNKFSLLNLHRKTLKYYPENIENYNPSSNHPSFTERINQLLNYIN